MMSGRFTGEELFLIFSFSPLWNRNYYFKRVPVFLLWSFFAFCGLAFVILPFVHFSTFVISHEMGPHVKVMNIIGVGLTPILYIYSLRHFLTTKGALIDGDGYPPKNPKKGSKNDTKMTDFHSNLMSKKCQKSCFLMAKSSFSLKSTIIDQKMTKNHQKLTHFHITKTGHNLTTKRGIVGVQVCQRESVSSFGHLI